MATKEKPQASAVAEKPLGEMGMGELGARYDKLNEDVLTAVSKRDAVGQEILKRMPGVQLAPAATPPPLALATNGHSGSNGHTAAPARTAPTNRVSGKGGKRSGGETDKPAPAQKGKWKPAILVYLRNHEDEGGKLKEITLHCIEMVKAGHIDTKVDPEDNPQVAQNVSQSLNAMKKDGLVNQAEETKSYLIAEKGKEWLTEQGL